MTPVVNFIALCIILVAITTVLSHCKSPVKQEENSMDSIAVVDTAIVVKNVVADVLQKPLTLIIKNLASATAPVIVGLYNSKKNFLKVEGRLKEYRFIPTGTTLTAHITDLSYGQFAMAVYQDENSSGEIDKNMIGIPTEGYAFSNNYKPRIKAPGFDDCRFTYDSSTNTVTMNIIK